MGIVPANGVDGFPQCGVLKATLGMTRSYGFVFTEEFVLSFQHVYFKISNQVRGFFMDKVVCEIKKDIQQNKDSMLITGVNSCIGYNLKKYFIDQYDLLTPTSSELDLTDRVVVAEYFEKHKIDFIIHCANRGGVRGKKDEPNVVKDNILMFENIFQNR